MVLIVLILNALMRVCNHTDIRNLSTMDHKFQLINGLHFRNIRGDIYGGITAAIVALPLALAFGVSSGAGPIAGLYGAVCTGLCAALFGGTPSQISGPTGPMTVVMAGIFTHYTSLDPINGPAAAFTIVIMAGLMQAGLSFVRVGQYINYVPLPVVSGFMSGIGVIIILLQLPPLLGQPSPTSPVMALRNLGSTIDHIVWPATMLGLVTLVLVYLTPRTVARLIPPALVALLAGTVAAIFLTSPEEVTLLGDIPSGLPQIQSIRIELALLPGMLKSAMVLAILGSIDSLLTSLVADNVTRTQHKSNRELFGQGLGNMMAGFLGGLPGAGATMRTVVNIKSGGSTPISGALHALILLAIVLGLGGVAEYIPHVVLAAILIKVGTDIIDWDYFRRIPHTPHPSVSIMMLVFTITVFVDLITAFAIGMTCSSLVFLKRQSDQQIDKMKVNRGGDITPLPEREAELLKSLSDQVVLFQLGGSTSFGAAKSMVHKINHVDEFSVLVLDLTNVNSIDTTTAAGARRHYQNDPGPRTKYHYIGRQSRFHRSVETTAHINPGGRRSYFQRSIQSAGTRPVTAVIVGTPTWLSDTIGVRLGRGQAQGPVPTDS